MKLRNLTYNSDNYINRKISVQPELLIAFMQHKTQHVGRVWLSLKFLDYQGCGVLPVDYVKQILCNKESEYYLMTWGNLLKTLHKYNGDFWQFANGRIVVYSPAKIANHYELAKFGFDAVWVYPEQLFKGTAVFNAACYAGYVTTLGDMPTSRETIKNETGIGKTSQIRYEQIAGIDINANVVTMDMFPAKEEEIKNRKERGISTTYVEVNGAKLLVKRIGNCFNYKKMVKKHSGRNRRRINKSITSVLSGKRNKRLSDYDKTMPKGFEPCVSSNGKKIVRQYETVLKQVVKFKEVLKKDFSAVRYAVMGDIDCHVFVLMNGF